MLNAVPDCRFCSFPAAEDCDDCVARVLGIDTESDMYDVEDSDELSEAMDLPVDGRYR